MPAEILLTEWSKSENATVETLVRILKNCERDDIISILYSDSRNPAFLQQQQGVMNSGHMVTTAAGNPGIPICNPNSHGRSIGGLSYSNQQQGHMGNNISQGQINVGQGHPGGLHMASSGNVGHGQNPQGGQGHHMINSNVCQGQISGGQGQLNLGQGHSSVSGSSTTDVSGTGGPRYGIGGPSSGGFQHVVPSYHSLQSGQQMV